MGTVDPPAKARAPQAAAPLEDSPDDRERSVAVPPAPCPPRRPTSEAPVRLGLGNATETRTLAKNRERIKTKEEYMGKLEGRIAPIIGSNSGIGLATAKQFVNESSRPKEIHSVGGNKSSALPVPWPEPL